ncbi:MAG: Coenzyme F420 hydrogenase/dehydrogenase, beta subunit C-terminal domain [Acidimicrobiia bacterium]|nr:Coenzyme F420 hydrogenase/dehydrogenase, beta subunit C-terminal domain [Acidimicrobiia bacterium]
MTPPLKRDPVTMRVSARYEAMLDSGGDPHEWAYAWRTELNRGGFRAVDFLMDRVVAAGRCVGCASCVTVCPVDVFEYADEAPIPTRADACVLCVLCADVCPVLRPADRDLDDLLGYRDPAEDRGFGAYAYGWYARATDPAIRDRAQDGGVASALLIHALETGRIAGAVLGDVMPDDSQIGRPRLARDRHAVLACAGSRYTYSPNTLALQEAMRSKVAPLAVVGVPCQVDGMRLQQHSSIRLEMADWYRSNVTLVLGLFCSEAFTHESLDRLGEMLGVERGRIANINIKGKVVVRLDDGEVRTTSLKRYREFARPACLYCVDYGAEHADIGLGGIGLDGWTFTLVRTERGHEAFEAALHAGVIEVRPLADEPRGMMLLEKLSADKKANRPHPARMPSLSERRAQGWLDPKTYYTKGPGAPAGVAAEDGT